MKTGSVALFCASGLLALGVASGFVPPVQRNSRCLLLEMALDPDPRDVVQDLELCTFDNRPGCVLLSQPGEHDHFLSKAAVFVFEHNEQGTQGVILGRQSAFSVGETAPGIAQVFAPNTLFIGGESGPDMAIMFHKYDLDGYAKYVGGGIYVGGLRQARERLDRREAVPKDFKFIFNTVQWAPGLLEQEIAQKRWDVVRMPREMVLEQKRPSSLWMAARNSLRSKQAFLDNDDSREDD